MRNKFVTPGAASAPYVSYPTVWLGHDLKSSIRIWEHIPHCPGVMLSAHQILQKHRFRRDALEVGLREHLRFWGPIFFDSGGFLLQKNGSCRATVDEVLQVYEEL